MIERKITGKINDWYKNSDKSLLIDGARQIGKTTTIKNFLIDNNLDYISFDLLSNTSVLDAFNSAKSAEDLLLKISALSNKEFVEGKTIIFFDEIQKADDAITVIKYLTNDKRYRYIFSGSLLGIKLNNILSIPVGFLEVYNMYPLDFEEFITAMSVSKKTISYLKDCFEKRIEVDEIVNKQMLDLFDLYLVVGGMPEAVDNFIKKKDIYSVNKVLKTIDNGYKLDLVKYQDSNTLQIDEIYDLIPSELNNQNKRFILKDLNQYNRFYQLESSFVWLKHSGIGLFAYNVDNPVYPLLASKERTLFKLFLNDVGILSYKLFSSNQYEILKGETSLNNGAIYEAYIAMEFNSHGYSLFYNNDKKRGEIDFLIEDNNEVIPVEVKSGKDYKRHNALNNMLENEEFGYKKAYVFTHKNIEVIGKKIYLPMYMSMFIIKEKEIENIKIDIDISALV